MSAESWIRIALVVLVVMVVAALIVFGLATRSFAEEEEPPKPAQNGSAVEEGISKTRQEIKDTQQEIKETQQEIEARTQGGK